MLRSRVLIKIPTEAKDLFVDDPFYENLFENDFLIFNCHAGNYKQIYEGDTTSFFDGSGATVLKSSLKRYGFEITTKDGREAIPECIKLAINDAYTDYEYTPIVVRDYCNREGELVYKTRLGVITDFEVLGGAVVRGEDVNGYYTGHRLSQGFRFVFMEVDKRFLF